MIKDIEDFHKKFGLVYDGEPRMLPKDVEEFRIKFMQEELQEYIDAETQEKKFDALIDLVYVALGTSYLHGFPFGKGWTTVHRANMNKVRTKNPDDSKRNSSFDVVKPEGWKPPDIKKVLEHHRKLKKLILKMQNDQYDFLAQEGDR